MFNQAIYSEEKISRAVDVFSDLLDRIMRTDDPDRDQDFTAGGRFCSRFSTCLPGEAHTVPKNKRWLKTP